jgi:signal transduction histidine kinase
MAHLRHRLPPAVDIALACALAAFALLELFLRHDFAGPRVVQVVATLAMTLPLAWRRVAPIPAATVSIAAMAASVLAGIPLTEGFAPILALGFAVYAVARADVLEDEMDEYTERATIEERERIARELHDVVAHRLSAIAVQAGAGLHVLHEDRDRARGAFEAIDETARSGLSEMRQALGLLRAQEAGAALAPQPSLRDVEHLAQVSRDAGIPVELTMSGDPSRLPAGLDLSAYRIVQEALTNVRRHAPGATARVALSVAPRLLLLQISDSGGSASAAGGHGGEPGHGLVGIRERVALYGGALEAGVQPGGGFLVRASIPLGDGAS